MTGYEPQDATLDVKRAFREIHERLGKLEAQWVKLEGNRLTGAQDAVTPTGLVTLRQLTQVIDRLNRVTVEFSDTIETLKLKNNLV